MNPLSLLALGLIAASPVAYSQSSWINTVGTGALEDAANWDVAPDQNADLLFNLTSPSSHLVTINDAHLFHGLTVANGNFTFEAAENHHGIDLGSGSYQLTTSGSVTFGSALAPTALGSFAGGELYLGSGSLYLHSNFLIRDRLVIGDTQSATFHHERGTVSIASGASLQLGTSGSYQLGSAAQLEIGGSSLTGSGAFHLNGGKIIVTGSDLNTSSNLTVASGRTILNTNAYNATLSGNIIDVGTAPAREFVKEGAGKLTFSGADRDLHGFATLGGTMEQTGGDTRSWGFLVGYGVGNTASFDLTGGSLTIASKDGSTGTLRVGDYGGTGIFNQRSGSVVVEAGANLVVGNFGGKDGNGDSVSGHGTYNLSGGTLTLNGGLHNVGRSESPNHVWNGPSVGIFNLSGGTLTVQDEGSFIIGNRQAGLNYGSGTFHQTGGTADFRTGKLYVGGYGPGSYNLLGGELWIGGSRLNTPYNSPSTTYAFNLGGGTLIVDGAALTSGIRATLLASTTSVIDTNGLSANFTTSISGAGNLEKRGAGTLSISSLTAGEVFVSAGNLTVGTLITGAVHLAQNTALVTGSHTVGQINADQAFIGAQGGGTFHLASGSVLTGSATFLTGARISGTVRAGNNLATGVITATELLTVANGSRFEWDFLSTSDYDRMEGESGLILEGTIAFHLIFGSDIDFSDSEWESYGQTWLLMEGELLGMDDFERFVVTSNVSTGDYGRFIVTTDTQSGVLLEWAAIPEPSTATLLVLSGAALMLRRRRR